MDKPSKNKPAAGRYALLDELRGLDLLSMIGYHACWDLIFLFGMSAAWYTGLAGAPVAAEHLLGVHSAVWLLPGRWGIAHCGAG